jgi:hypothetical protein
LPPSVFPTTSIRAACGVYDDRQGRSGGRLQQPAPRRLDYDRRHGYRGAEAYVDISEIKSEQDEALDELLLDFQDAEDLHPAIVLDADSKRIRAYRRGGEIVTISGEGLKFAARMIDDKAPPQQAPAARRGHSRPDRRQGHWRIVQLPEVEGRLSWPPIRTTVRSARWSAASTSTATSSTTSRRRGGNRGRASSPSSIPARSKRASPRPR